MLTEREKLETLSHLGIDLNRVQDLDILMERILTEARRFVNADAGSIYIREGDTLHFSYTQNATLQDRLPAGQKLIYSTFKIPIDETSIAGHVALTGDLLNISDVYTILPTAPYGFKKDIDEAAAYKTRSMLTLPLLNVTGKVMGVLQVINAQDGEGRSVPFSAEDESMMKLFASIAAVALERARMTRAIILRMIKMAEMRDPKETGAHVNRVGGYAVEIYERWAELNSLPRQEIDRNRDVLRIASMLHDVGKVGISDLILKKPARFNNDEFEIMKQHTILGARLFMEQQSEFDAVAAQVALNHHERWDGHGYPGHVDFGNGNFFDEGEAPRIVPAKKGVEIPLFGRIVALADVFDALSSARVYKPAWSEERVLETIASESGRQFDPELVEIFFSRLEIFRAIQERFRESDDSESEA